MSIQPIFVRISNAPFLRNRKWQLLLPTAGIVLLMAISAASLPRLATEQGVPCEQCHISATGGGARNEFGNYSVALHELCLPQTKAPFIKEYRSPRVAPSLLVGFDTRHLFLDDGSLLRMQTDAYLTFQPYRHLQYHLRFADIGVRENYALVTLEDYAYYLKVGRFIPAFGLHNSDHTAYNRERTGNGPLVYLDGLSLGVRRWGIHIMAEVMDASGQGVYGTHVYRVGTISPFSYQLGFSFRFSEKSFGSYGSFPHARALFGGLNWNRFTLLGETDLVGAANDTLVTYAQLAARLEYGLYLIGEYNFFDDNRHTRGGEEEYIRISTELYPIPFVQIRPSYTHYARGPRKGDNSVFLIVHFGY